MGVPVDASLCCILQFAGRVQGKGHSIHRASDCRTPQILRSETTQVFLKAALVDGVGGQRRSAPLPRSLSDVSEGQRFSGSGNFPGDSSRSASDTVQHGSTDLLLPEDPAATSEVRPVHVINIGFEGALLKKGGENKQRPPPARFPCRHLRGVAAADLHREVVHGSIFFFVETL